MYLFSINIQCKVNKIQLSPILSISCHENTILTIYGMQLTFASQNNHNIVLTTRSLVSTQQSSMDHGSMYSSEHAHQLICSLWLKNVDAFTYISIVYFYTRLCVKAGLKLAEDSDTLRWVLKQLKTSKNHPMAKIWQKMNMFISSFESMVGLSMLCGLS